MLRDASVCCIRFCNLLKAGSRPGEGYFVAVLLLLPEHFEYCIPCLIELHISEKEKKSTKKQSGLCSSFLLIQLKT